MGTGKTDDAVKELRQARRDVGRAHDRLVDAEVEAGLRGRMSDRTKLILAIIAAVLLAVAIWATWYGASGPSRYSDDDYLDAATAEVELLVNADAGDRDRAAKILERATGAFGDAFAQSADAYSEFVRQSGAQGDGEIDGAAVAGRSLQGAQVLVAASVQVQTRDGDRESAPVQQLRLRVTVVPEDGQLKVSGLVMIP